MLRKPFVSTSFTPAFDRIWIPSAQRRTKVTGRSCTTSAGCASTTCATTTSKLPTVSVHKHRTTLATGTSTTNVIVPPNRNRHERRLFSTYRQADGTYTQIPKSVSIGVEIDVRIVKTTTDYALCRPLYFPRIKGIIPNTEVDELEGLLDASSCIDVNMIYKASVMRLIPPDKLTFSLRRVRRILRDDFHPFTIVCFDLPYDLQLAELKELMEEDGGEVVGIDLSYKFHAEEDSEIETRGPSFVTFLNKEGAMAAVRKWNTTKMPAKFGKEIHYYTVRCMKSARQDYRERLQERLDYQLKEKIEKWESLGRSKYEYESPYYMGSVHQYLYDWDKIRTLDMLTIKNNPRTFQP